MAMRDAIDGHFRRNGHLARRTMPANGKLKVWRGSIGRSGKHLIIAAYSAETVAAATGETPTMIRKFWGLSRNFAEIEAAMANPGKLLEACHCCKPIFREAGP